MIGIGELLWDCFEDKRQPGGATANVAFHANQLGVHGVVASRVGRDKMGDALVSELTGCGMSVRAIQRDDHHPTGRVTVDSTRPDHPMYTIHENVAWDYLEFDDELAAVSARASAICFGTLAQRSETSRTTIQRILDANQHALRIYDVNLRPPWYTPRVIEESMRRCNVVKMNDEEARILGGLFGIQASHPMDFAQRLRTQFDLAMVCVTRGAEGCLLSAPGECVDVPGQRVDVMDSVGAGDAFTAALVCGLLWQWPLSRIASFANRFGGLVASRHGAMPRLQGEIRELLEQNKP